MEKLLPVLMLVVVGLWFFSRQASGTGPEKIRTLVQEGGLLIDVRSPQEFAAGHASGARNIPLQQLEKRLGELGGTETQIGVYCRSGARSGKAKAILEGKGFTRVHNLGGVTAVQEALSLGKTESNGDPQAAE